MHSFAIVTEDLCKDFRVGFALRRQRVLHHLNLQVEEGEVFGYLGPNGAGKTTTIKLLLGLIFPTSGEVSLLGREATHPEARSRLGFLPENPYFYDHLTGREFLDYCGRLLKMEGKRRRSRIAELLERLGIAKAADLQLRRYSKGMIQRIGLAQALLNDPDLLILDEPMSGLDPLGRREVRDLILSLKEEGKTIFFSSHILPDVEMICDRVGILVGGRLREVGVLEEMLEARIESIEVTVREPDFSRLSSLDLPLSSPPRQRGDRVLLLVADENTLRETLDRLHEARVRIVSIVPQRETLEDYFLREVNPGREEGGRAR